MFEDEMREGDVVKTAEEYYSLNLAEKHEEALAVARAYICSLEAMVFSLKYQRAAEGSAFGIMMGSGIR